MNNCYLTNITYTYPGQNEATLKNIDLTIEKGSFTLLAGISGSGKSTLGKVIKGIVPKLYGGTLSGTLKSDDFGYVLQDPEKQMLMTTVERELAFGMENIGIPYNIMRKRVAEILDYIGLSHLRKAETNSLSGGQKQKLAIGCAIAMGYDGIILDEPTGQLDPVSSIEILSLLKRLNEEQGMTILLIEQKLDNLFESVDRVLFLENGALIFDGTPSQFVASTNPAINEVLSAFTLAFKKASEASLIANCPLSVKSARRLLSRKSIYQLTSETTLKKETENPIIKLKQVAYSYDNKNMHLSVDKLNIEKGEILGIIGENGSGKSTLLKVLSGVLSPQHGNIMKPSHQGFLSQNPNDYFFEPRLQDEIQQVLTLHQKEWSEEYLRHLEVLGMSDFLNKNPRDLSGGERQRAALAIVLASNPSVLLLDEPTRGLNKGLKRQLIQLLKELNRSGITIVIISHDMELISDLATRVAIVSSGKLQVVDRTENLLSDGLFYVSDFGKLFASYGLKIVTSEEGTKTLMSLKECK